MRHTIVLLLSLFAFSATAETFNVPIVRVVDGDSLVVLMEGRHVHVRLREIDAPERKQPFGKQSQQSLGTICSPKSTARIEWREKDRSGRLLARVWCSRVDANAEQVSRGMAWVFDRYVKDRSLYALQDRARTQRFGLWVDVHPTPPWEWRAAKGESEYRAAK